MEYLLNRCGFESLPPHLLMLLSLGLIKVRIKYSIRNRMW